MMSKADASKKKLTKFEYPKDIDKELIPLLDTIGSVPGLRPLFSCCGHRYKEFLISLLYRPGLSAGCRLGAAKMLLE